MERFRTADLQHLEAAEGEQLMDLQTLQSDPSAFQQAIHVQTGSGTRRFGEIMADFQRERFAAINPSLLAVANQSEPPISRVWDERTKGASKDTDASINFLWLLAFSRRPLRIQIGAYDSQQADEIRLIVKQILRIDEPVNRFLSQVLDAQSDKIINSRTDSLCEILTTDKLGSHGSRPDVVLINELTHQSDSGFAETLLDNLDKMPFGLGIIATNSGHNPSWQQRWKATFADSDRWRILEYNDPAPWITEAALAESRKRNSSGRYNRLWKGIWGSDTGSAIEPVDIDAAIVLRGPIESAKRGWIFAAGLDIGIRKHASGLVVVARHVGYSEEKEIPPKLSRQQRALIDAGAIDEPEPEYETKHVEGTDRLRLAYARSWKPSPGKRVSLEAIKTAILDVHDCFDLAGLALDPSQGEHLAELLERENVPVELTPQTANSLQDQCTAVIEAFQERQIELYDDADLIADLRVLQIKDSGLKMRLVSPERAGAKAGTGHGDLASALSFAIPLVKRLQGRSHTSNRRLIAYP